MCTRYIVIDDLVCSGHTINTIKQRIGDYFYSGAKLVGIYLYILEHSSYRTHQKVKDYLGIELLNDRNDERIKNYENS